MSRVNRQPGFTIIELLIATAVFSVVLLIALTSFILLGRLFYKGVSMTETQNAARQILNNVSDNIKLANEITLHTTSDTGYDYYCLGNVRYTYKLYKPVDKGNLNKTSTNGNFGLITDRQEGASGCQPPTEANLTGELLLSDKMRLSSFSIDKPYASSPNTYRVDITVAYGDDDVMDNPNSANPVCKLSNQGGQFCAVHHLTTTVDRGNGL